MSEPLQPFTVSEFRDRIADMLRAPGTPALRNEAYPSLVRKPGDKGYAPPAREGGAK